MLISISKCSTLEIKSLEALIGYIAIERSSTRFPVQEVI